MKFSGAVVLWTLVQPVVVPHELSPPRISPGHIEVGAFYEGATVMLEGEIEAGSKAIVTVAGPTGEETFKTKTRFGPIWLTSGKIRVSGAPSLFLRFSSEPTAGLLYAETPAMRGLDKPSLMNRMSITPPGRDDARIRFDYAALKEEDGMYSFGDGGVRLAETRPNASYSVRFQWPRKAPPARYEVRIYEVRDGAVFREASAPLDAIRAGFPAWLAETAKSHASYYGITAVLIGSLAGFGIDLLTSRVFGAKRTSTH
jgi:hypothetical protein